ncbi:aminopeptidase P family protein [Paraburkholderia sp. Ac-20340]|uniref:M24 family metallopeptidase n=1 Tax=Paraburkholderia sp. Ac-20340 TaxID=2703888 RepID=UPI00197D54B0|nr:Xaa-Pro peptidase family protein [Paraburkholderia sp. Ac-20340]MBN3853966.1 aminopeptidase P family protein [Paraburkholderia sp. Ac-20340]
MTAGKLFSGFSQQEYEQRIAQVRTTMAERGGDLLLVDQIDNMAYLFGYAHSGARYQAGLLPLVGSPVLIVRRSDLLAARDKSWVEEFVAYEEYDDEVQDVARAISEFAPKKLLVEADSNFLTVQRMEKLRSRLGDLEVADFSGVMWEQRLIKSPAEIDCLARASAIADAAIMSGVNAVGVGKSERDPACATYAAAIELGADNGRVAVFGYGSTVANMHGRLGDRTMEAGELYFIEAVPQVSGYSARIARPIALAHASAKHQHIAERLVAIQDRQIAAMVPGAISGEVDRLCRDAVLKEGLKAHFPQVTGYTLGFHAVPRTSDHTRIFMPNETWRIEAGMVFHIIVYAEGIPFSETVHVTENGPRRLTKSNRELFVR